MSNQSGVDDRYNFRIRSGSFSLSVCNPRPVQHSFLIETSPFQIYALSVAQRNRTFSVSVKIMTIFGQIRPTLEACPY